MHVTNGRRTRGMEGFKTARKGGNICKQRNSKMSSFYTRLNPKSANTFEEEYVKSLEDTYSIKVSPTANHDKSMGGALDKMKSWKAEANNSPAKLESSSPTKRISPVKNCPPNGTHFTYEKAKLKAMVSQKNATLANKKVNNKDSVDSLGQQLKTRKRKLSIDSTSEASKKYKRLKSSDKAKTYKIHGVNVSKIYDAREIIVAKRAERLENETQSIKSEPIDECLEKPKSKEKLRVNNIHSGNNLGVYKTTSKVDKSAMKMVDQNLNHLTENISRENLNELYSKKLHDVSDTSPFKGKMSAFEISLLKGKQNLERRKSIESATLRSSPRMNANVPKVDYSEKKRRKSRLSLASSLDELAVQTSDWKWSRAHRRRQTMDVNSKVSPSSVENKMVNKEPKRRRSQVKEKSEVAQVSRRKSLKYRLNGSRKLNNLPTRLSLDSLSGTNDQGSFHTEVTTDKISGTPPALYSSSFTYTQDKSPSSHSKPLLRPNSLPVEICASPKKSEKTANHCYQKATETARSKNAQLTKMKSKKSLEETVNMLRRNTSARSREPSLTKLSPARSESRMSRRSSRSVTPNVSPIKSEILTPNSTPCSSPSKSTCSTPVCGTSKSRKVQKKVKTLYVIGQEVLARWHDGLYYLGEILKVDEKRTRCLLRYEDDSEYWSLFKDIHRVLKEEEMMCCVCLSDVSEPPNEIVLCEYCLQGYHQQCHSPNVGSGSIVDPDEPWYCRKCVFLGGSKSGDNSKDEGWDAEMRVMKSTLPYSLETLTWDQQHKNNIESIYCYCGGPGIWFQKMLQCCRCKQWFHEACMQCLEYPLLYADSFYIFVCSPCNAGNEYVKRIDVEWADLIHIGLFNLAVLQRRKYFDLNTEIMPWLSENWDKLQVVKYNDLNDEQKLTEVTQALETNKTRFSNGMEVRKKVALWGLRVRVPPPRIHITLPFTGVVTDALMNKLKIKGRRSMVFMPVECKSPVNHLQHSPLHPSSSVKKRLDAGALDQINSSPSKSTRKPKKKLPFLDTVIPIDEMFTNENNPFKTEIELEDEKEDRRAREEIWNKFLELFDCRDDMESNTATSDLMLDDPPVLEKVEPIAPIITCNGTPPMPEIQEKKPLTKKVPKLQNTAKERAKRSRKSVQRTNIVTDVKAERVSDVDFTVKHIKAVVGGNYYCCHDKNGYGRGFTVMGRRLDGYGHVEYMVKWD